MKLLFFSDLHANNHKPFSYKLDNARNSRLQDAIDIIDQLTAFCIEESVDVVLFLGDAFHIRTSIDIDVYSSTFEAFRKLSKACKKLIILKGNHDQHLRIGNVHSLEPFREIAKVIDKPESFYYEELIIAAHPYTPDANAFKQWVATLEGGDLFLFHEGIKDAVVGPYDCPIDAELELSDIPHEIYKYCCGGDFHATQWLNDNTLYIGSPYQQNMGERNSAKGVYFVDTKDWAWQFIETNAPKFFTFESQCDFLSSLEDGTVDIEKDFINVSIKENELDNFKAKYPFVSCSLIREEKIANTRISEEDIGSDKDLLLAYIRSQNSSVPEEDLFDLGFSLLSDKGEE